MVCPRCAKQNESDARFCAKCGRDLVEAAREQNITPNEETLYCYRHPKESTGLRCGRCERPVCTKCVILGPAGPRCRDCAKSDVPIRPAAIALGAKRGVRAILGGVSWYSWIVIFVLLGLLIRGCQTLTANLAPPVDPQSAIESTPPPESIPPPESNQPANPGR